MYVFDPTSPAFCDCVYSGDELSGVVRELLAAGQPVGCIPLNRVVSTAVAANFLNLPLAAVLRLVEGGQLPPTGSGVRFADLFEHRRRMMAERRAARAELDRANDALGFED
jgi:hypothetical protein